MRSIHCLVAVQFDASLMIVRHRRSERLLHPSRLLALRWVWSHRSCQKRCTPYGVLPERTNHACWFYRLLYISCLLASYRWRAKGWTRFIEHGCSFYQMNEYTFHLLVSILLRFRVIASCLVACWPLGTRLDQASITVIFLNLLPTLR